MECPRCSEEIAVPGPPTTRAARRAEEATTSPKSCLLYISLMLNFALATAALSVALFRPSPPPVADNPRPLADEVPTAGPALPDVFDVITTRRLVLVDDDGTELAELGPVKGEGESGAFPRLSLFNPTATSAGKRGIELTSCAGLNRLVFHDPTGKRQLAAESSATKSDSQAAGSSVSLSDRSGCERLQLLVKEGSTMGLTVHGADRKIAARFGSARVDEKDVGIAVLNSPADGSSMIYTAAGQVDATKKR